MNNPLGSFFIVLGLILNFFGCIGLIRFPDVYTRLQSSAKCVMLGTCAILLGLFMFKGFTAAGIKALLCIVFIALTTPVSVHALAKGAFRSGVKPWDGSVADEYVKDIIKKR